MSESENQTEKKKSPMGIIIVIILLLVGGGIFINMQKSKSINNSNDMIEVSSLDEKIDAPEESHEHSTMEADETTIVATETIEENATQEDNVTSSNSGEFNLEKASKPRILGDINAPIKISEHSSFTCGHCAKYHKTNFKEIKRDFVDTGKAYIIYNDFPLNNIDVSIGAISRCVSEESFFDFIQLVFETQNTWRKVGNIDPIRQNAKLTGASDAMLDSCANSEELYKAIVQQREDAVANHKVSSTPTLVINDSIVIPGLSDYSKLKEVLDAEYEKATTEKSTTEE